MAKISAELNELAIEALNLGFGCFSDGDRVPFAMIVEHGDKRHLVDFPSATGTVDGDYITGVRQIIAKTFQKAERYALVWDGYLTTDGIKQASVFAETGEQGKAKAFIVAQPYRQKNRPKTLERIGDPIAVQLTSNLLKTAKSKR